MDININMNVTLTADPMLQRLLEQAIGGPGASRQTTAADPQSDPQPAASAATSKAAKTKAKTETVETTPAEADVIDTTAKQKAPTSTPLANLKPEEFIGKVRDWLAQDDSKKAAKVVWMKNWVTKSGVASGKPRDLPPEKWGEFLVATLGFEGGAP